MVMFNLDRYCLSKRVRTQHQRTCAKRSCSEPSTILSIVLANRFKVSASKWPRLVTKLFTMATHCREPSTEPVVSQSAEILETRALNLAGSVDFAAAERCAGNKAAYRLALPLPPPIPRAPQARGPRVELNRKLREVSVKLYPHESTAFRAGLLFVQRLHLLPTR